MLLRNVLFFFLFVLAVLFQMWFGFTTILFVSQQILCLLPSTQWACMCVNWWILSPSLACVRHLASTFSFVVLIIEEERILLSFISFTHTHHFSTSTIGKFNCIPNNAWWANKKWNKRRQNEKRIQIQTVIVLQISNIIWMKLRRKIKEKENIEEGFCFSNKKWCALISTQISFCPLQYEMYEMYGLV